MATIFTPASDVWIKGHDQRGNVIWYNKEAHIIHHVFYNSPGQPPVLPGSYLAEAPYSHLRAGYYFTPAAAAVRSPTEMSAALILRETVHRVHNPTQKKAHYEPANGRIMIAPATSNIRVLPLFPPNNATRPAPCTPKKEGHQWCTRRNEKGQTYYVNTKTSECQMETPDCFKKYTAK